MMHPLGLPGNKMGCPDILGTVKSVVHAMTIPVHAAGYLVQHDNLNITTTSYSAECWQN